MVHYIGEYVCKIDSGGRLLLPATLLKQMPDNLRKQFVLSKSIFDESIVLNPMDSWAELTKKLAKLNPRFNKQHNEFIRRFTDGNSLVELDNSNRILIPKLLLDFAKIKTEITLTCSLDSIEIWNSKAYKQKMESYKKSNLAKLTEDVMKTIDLANN